MYRPWMGRYIGVEMEMNDRDTRARPLRAATIATALEGQHLPLNHQRAGAWYSSSGNTWDVKSDSSAGPGGGWEVATPKLLLDAQGHNQDLRRGCNAIAALQPAITTHCGLHVHIDLSDFTWDNMHALVALWTRYEPLLYELVPASRRGNYHCRGLRTESWEGRTTPRWAGTSMVLNARSGSAMSVDRLVDVDDDAKYASLNLLHWWRSRRVEVRLFAGTVDYDKIRMWSMLMLAIVARAKHATAARPQPIVAGQKPVGFSTRYFARQLGLVPGSVAPECPPEAAQLVTWIETRRAKFGPGA